MKRNIFLTSLPRSGSTWSSNVIAYTLGAELVYEPFNWKNHPEREPYHMQYYGTNSTDQSINAILESEIRSKRRIFKRIFSSDVVIKDVHACLAIEGIYNYLKSKVVIVVRHPCGVANSWNKLGLEAGFRIQKLLRQDALREYLSPFITHIQSSDDYFFEIGVYWGATYYLLNRISDQHPDWIWVAHESLCIDSYNKYLELFGNLNIFLGKKSKKRLKRFLARNNRPRFFFEGSYSISRVSENEPDKWKVNLTDKEISNVLRGAEPFKMMELLDDLV